MWLQEKSWTELRSSFDSNHFDDSRRKTLWNALWLQGKKSFSYRIPSLLGCLLTMHQVQWNPHFEKIKHSIMSVCLFPDAGFYAPFKMLLSLSAPWSFCPAAGLPSSDSGGQKCICWIVNPPKQSCSSFCTPQITQKEEVTLCCHAQGLVYKKKQVWLMLGLVTAATWPCKNAKDSEFGTLAPENPNTSTLCIPQLVLPSAPPPLPWLKQHMMSIPPLCSSSIPSKPIFSPLQSWYLTLCRPCLGSGHA